eukprot:3136271-Pleurochrysis_carterae.AAC.3
MPTDVWYASMPTGGCYVSCPFATALLPSPRGAALAEQRTAVAEKNVEAVAFSSRQLWRLRFRGSFTGVTAQNVRYQSFCTASQATCIASKVPLAVSAP